MPFAHSVQGANIQVDTMRVHQPRLLIGSAECPRCQGWLIQYTRQLHTIDRQDSCSDCDRHNIPIPDGSAALLLLLCWAQPANDVLLWRVCNCGSGAQYHRKGFAATTMALLLQDHRPVL